MNLSGQIAIVTGASRGLGQYFGRALARAGADLIITARSLDSLTEFKEEIEALGRRAIPLELDVQSEASITQFGKDALAAYGKIDILVNNAGCNIRKPSVEVTFDDWQTVVDTKNPVITKIINDFRNAVAQ